jgi:hypothetical protein
LKEISSFKQLYKLIMQMQIAKKTVLLEYITERMLNRYNQIAEKCMVLLETSEEYESLSNELLEISSFFQLQNKKQFVEQCNQFSNQCRENALTLRFNILLGETNIPHSAIEWIKLASEFRNIFTSDQCSIEVGQRSIAKMIDSLKESIIALCEEEQYNFAVKINSILEEKAWYLDKFHFYDFGKKDEKIKEAIRNAHNSRMAANVGNIFKSFIISILLVGFGWGMIMGFIGNGCGIRELDFTFNGKGIQVLIFAWLIGTLITSIPVANMIYKGDYSYKEDKILIGGKLPATIFEKEFINYLGNIPDRFRQ